MDQQGMVRSGMAALGMAAGLALFLLSEIAGSGALSDRLLMMLLALCATFFTALLAMAGPLRLRRALLGATVMALGVSGLLGIASLGFETVEGLLNSPQAVLGALVLGLVPMPFSIAAHGAGWRDYPTLFGESWSIVVRYGAAWAFVALVWAVILLSDALLRIVGITLIEALLDLGPMPWLITGGGLGLGMAVVQELSEYVSPYVILRLLRLLLPVVFGVSVVFLLALPVRGIEGLFGTFSFALTLLAMAGAAATLVTTAVDQDDAQATQSRILANTARAMAILLPVMSALGAWAVWQRVAQYGWTPERLFAAEIAVLGLGYGFLYAIAALRGQGWMARVRQANVWMALALMAMAVLVMTPILSAERISTNSLMARLDDGRLPVDSLDPGLLSRWGRYGAEARAVLEARALEPGQETLAARLAEVPVNSSGAPDRAALLSELAQTLPLQPAGAAATRDIYLNVMDDWRLQTLRDSCALQMPGGGKGCVMVVADLLPSLPGEEAMLVAYTPSGYVEFTGFKMDLDAGPMLRDVVAADTALPQYDAGADLIRAWQLAPPPAVQRQMNQFNLPEGGALMLLP